MLRECRILLRENEQILLLHPKGMKIIQQRVGPLFRLILDFAFCNQHLKEGFLLGFLDEILLSNQNSRMKRFNVAGFRVSGWTSGQTYCWNEVSI